ncbi:hypothetical protein B5E58_11085 [Tyzzerella sp. An114]|uniref:hypothetical protein n=1 Tax=Tyzzerella sp. An114 TaxID=1965545 RepID=UPI000B447487|nr:hypothetical protein [Tyzzerella sp. An114]OUQ56211.1 hypothetical protein B5E58_11085 [Tyzzerella sp. An114]
MIKFHFDENNGDVNINIKSTAELLAALAILSYELLSYVKLRTNEEGVQRFKNNMIKIINLAVSGDLDELISNTEGEV